MRKISLFLGMLLIFSSLPPTFILMVNGQGNPIIIEYTVPTSFSWPSSIVVDSSGIVWFTERATNKIGKFDPSTEVFNEYTIPTPNSWPYGTELDSEGNIWFYEGNSYASTGYDHIGNFNPSTETFTEYKIPHVPTGPSRLAIDSNNVIWITRQHGGGNDKIGKFEPSTQTLTEYSIPTWNAHPEGIVELHGIIWFTEYYGYKIGKFDSITETFTEYSIPTVPSNPFGITISNDNIVWFTEYSSNKIGRFDPVKETFTEFDITTANSGPNSITIDSQGIVWFTEYQTNKIGFLDPDTGITTEFDVPTPNCGLGDGNIGITVAQNGNIWFVETNANKIGVLISTPPVAPDFEVSISPSILNLHVGGWNNSATLLIKSIGGLNGPIELIFEGESRIAIISFDNNPVYLPADGQVSVEIVVGHGTDAIYPLGLYEFKIIGVFDSIIHKASFVVNLIGNSIAIKNLVNVESLSLPSRWRFATIQQNFIIAASNGTPIYWCQNIVEILSLTSQRAIINSRFQVFQWGVYNKPFENSIGIPRVRTLPLTFNLTSYIDRDILILENNATIHLPFQLQLPSHSYIVGSSNSLGSFLHSNPEIVIVGGAKVPLLGHPWKVARFKAPTWGFVYCYSKLVNESTWRSTLNTVLNPTETQTGEESYNLSWHLDGTFHYSDGSIEQGLSFSPDYE